MLLILLLSFVPLTLLPSSPDVPVEPLEVQLARWNHQRFVAALNERQRQGKSVFDFPKLGKCAFWNLLCQSQRAGVILNFWGKFGGGRDLDWKGMLWIYQDQAKYSQFVKMLSVEVLSVLGGEFTEGSVIDLMEELTARPDEGKIKLIVETMIAL